MEAKQEQGTTALIFAARNGQPAAAELLIEKGAAVNWQRGDGATALMRSCVGGHPAVARLLLEKGADRTLADENGHTAAYFVQEAEKEEAKEELRALLA